MGPSQWRGPRRGRECLWLGQDARGDPDGPQRRRGDPSGLNSLSARVVLPSRLFLRPEVKPPLVLAFGSRGACLGIRTETPRRSSPRQRSSSERVAHVLPGETGSPRCHHVHVPVVFLTPQHVQLLTQIHLLSTFNPSLNSEASTTRIFLVSVPGPAPPPKASVCGQLGRSPHSCPPARPHLLLSPACPSGRPRGSPRLPGTS